MKFFTNKSIWTKIIIVLIFVILFEFVVAKPTVYAGDVVEFGGKLVTPVMSLLVAIGDGLVDVMHSYIMGQEVTLIPAFEQDSFLEKVFKTIAIIIAVVAAVIAIVTFGWTACIAVAIGAVAANALVSEVFREGDVDLSVSSFTRENLPESGEIYLPAYNLSPEEIFQGKILLFNVDFFSEPEVVSGHVVTDENGVQSIDYYYIDENRNGEHDEGESRTSKQNSAEMLRGTISKWYVGLRNVAIVGMMIVLLYIGIRILLSSTAGDKAKYLQMLRDWVIGLVLLAFMHYIMVFSNVIVKKVTEVISATVSSDQFLVAFPDYGTSGDDPVAQSLEGSGYGEGEEHSVVTRGDYNEDTGTFDERAGGGDTFITWPTNLMGKVRLGLQFSNWGMAYVGQALCFCTLVLFTIFFVFTYLKRLLYMAFLTIIAPLVALTYPIDKITDGQAQGFNKWLKEYIFNLLIQPMHLLLYYILVTSAFDLAGENVIYSLVAIGFMMPAEKLLRGFFGFEKASTPPALGGAAGTALAIGAMQKIGGLAKKTGGKLPSGSNKGGTNKNNEGTDKPPRMSGGVDMYGESGGGSTPPGSSGGGGSTPAGSNGGRGTTPSGSNGGRGSTSSGRNGGRGSTSSGRNSGRGKRQIKNTAKPIRTAKNQNKPRRRLKNTGKGSKMGEAKRFVRSAGRGIKNVAGIAGKGMKNVAGRAVNSRFTRSAGAGLKTMALNTAKALPRTVIDTATTVGGAVIGGAGGLALGALAAMTSGDAKQALNYMGAGAMLGGNVGGNIGDTMSTALENKFNLNQESPKEAFNQVYNGREYEEEAQNAYIKKFIKENKKLLERNFDKDEVAEMTENGGIVEKCLRSNINDVEDIMAAQHMLREGEATDVEGAVRYAKFAKRVGSEYDGPKAKEWESLITEEYQTKAGMTGETARTTANTTMAKIDTFNKHKKKLYK